MQASRMRTNILTAVSRRNFLPKCSGNNWQHIGRNNYATHSVQSVRSNLAAANIVKNRLLLSRNFSLTHLVSHSDSPQTDLSTSSLPKFNNLLITSPCEHVVAIELHKPKVKNAFCLNTAEDLVHALDSLESNSSVRCIILSGDGSDFTSGVDLKSFMGVYSQLQETEDVAKRAKLLHNIIKQFQAPFKRLCSFSKPIICVMHGLSIGLAMELAACSDIRYCAKDTKLAIREVMIGIAADVGSLQLLPRLMSNQSMLNELIFTGRFFGPDEALEWGFISRICDNKDLAVAAAVETACAIASRSPVAVQGSKVNLRFSRHKSFEDGLDYNAVWNMAMVQSEDVVKAIGAIMSREEAKFGDF